MSRLDAIARYIAETPRGSAPDTALDAARLALVDIIGVTVAGAREPVSRIVTEHLRRTSGGRTAGRGAASVATAGFATGAPDATLANATMGHALDFDDSSFVLGGHPSVTMFPALLALGETLGSSGRAVLEAYVIGFEVMMKFARAVNFGHYERGWHPTATLGVFGTAAAAARLLGLSAGQAGMAIGLAASSAAGVKANFGTMAKPYQVGRAAQQGLTCALLAADGMTASADAIEGKQGFLAVYNDEGDYRPDRLDAFGDTPEIVEPGLKFKKYACCGATHAPIGAALELRRGQDFAPGGIEAVLVRVNRRRLPHVNRPQADTPLEAKFSLQYTVAAALADGRFGLGHFTDEAVRRPDIRRIMARTEVEGIERGDDPLSQACEVVLTLKGGRELRAAPDDAPGRDAADYPGYMEEKFRDCLAHGGRAGLADDLFRDLTAFERLDDVGRIMRTLAAPVGADRTTMLAGEGT